MNPMSSFLFLVLLTAPYLTAADSSRVVPEQSSGTSLITKVCEHAPDKAFCTDVLNSNPDSKKSDLKQLAFIALQTASRNAADTSAYIKKLLLDDDDDDSVVDSSVQQGLSDCSESYSSIVDQINDAVDALVTGNAKDVETEMNAAIAAVDTCASGIELLKGQALEVSKKNSHVRQLCDNALSVYHVSAKH